MPNATSAASTELEHCYVSQILALVALPYKNPKRKETTRVNGTVAITITACGADTLPYGKCPRLMEMFAATMVRTHNPCYNPETRTLSLGKEFTAFLRKLGANVGGTQMKTMKAQVERLFRCVYTISDDTDSRSRGKNVQVSTEFNIEWGQTGHKGKATHNYVQFTPEYVEYLNEKAVPVNLAIAAQLSSVVSLDIYWWLTKRFYTLHASTRITWTQLQRQFGGEGDLKYFKRTFRKALDEVLAVYPEARVVCQKDCIILFPSPTSVPTVADTRLIEAHEAAVKEISVSQARREAAKQVEKVGKWRDIAGWGKVYCSREAFDVGTARAHLDGEMGVEECMLCTKWEENRVLHGSHATESVSQAQQSANL